MATEDPQPIQTSKCILASRFNEYRIYADQVELAGYTGPIVISFDDIERVELSPPTATWEGLLLHLSPFRLGIKLDLEADLREHIMIDRETGFWQRVDFTPENPAAFKTALDQAIVCYRERQGKSEI